MPKAKASPKAERGPQAPCVTDLTKSTADMLYLDMLRPHRRTEGDILIDRTPTAEWLTKQYEYMTYEIYGGARDSGEQLHHVAQAAVTFVRKGGDLANALLTRTPTGNLFLKLPIGFANAAFLLMIEKRLTKDVADVHNRTAAERNAIYAWIARAGVDTEPTRSTIPRDAAE